MDFYSKEYLQSLKEQYSPQEMLGMIIGDCDSLGLIKLYEDIPTKYGHLHLRTEYSDEINNTHIYIPSKSVPTFGFLANQRHYHHYWRGEWLRKILGHPLKNSCDHNSLEEEHYLEKPYADLILLEQRIFQELMLRYSLAFENWQHLWFAYELKSFHFLVESLFSPQTKTEVLNKSRKNLKMLIGIVDGTEPTTEIPLGQSDEPFITQIRNLMANLARENPYFDRHFFKSWVKLQNQLIRQVKNDPNFQISYFDKDSGLQHTGKAKQVSKGRKRKKNSKRRGFGS